MLVQMIFLYGWLTKKEKEVEVKDTEFCSERFKFQEDFFGHFS